MSNITQLIKQAAVEAVKAGDPSDIIYGTVASAEPLIIQINQKLMLTSEFLTLTTSVIDYKVQVKIYDIGEDETKVEKQMMNVYNGLKSGDKVILLKQQGGQRYVVLDKIIEKETEK